MTRQSEETAVAIARLTQEGFEYKDRDPEEAIQKFQTAYQKSRLIEDDDTERTCAFNLGAAYVGLNRAKEGLKYLHKATPPENECDDRSNGDLFFNMGIAFEQLGEDSNALKYYEKAHEEFQIKGGGNPALEKHCLQKCLHFQQKLKKFSDLAKMYKQMAAVNSAKRDYLGQADCLCKMAIQYQKAKQYETAAAAAMESLNVFNEFSPEGKECFAAARVLNELGLLYTQIQSYQEALQCFERALENVKQADMEDPQLQVVIKQNLGAAYNFLGDFQRAIKFHEEAIEHYSKLTYRNGQGQCFTNLAFALSQLVPPELKHAEVAFHHALRASVDTGDTNMRWQVLEGLGAVNFNQLNFEDAIRYFQDALQCVGQNKAASERIKAKLRLVIEYNFNQRKAGGPLSYTGKPDMLATTDRSPRLGTIKEGSIVPQQRVPMTSEMPMMSRSEEEPSTSAAPPQRRMIPIRKRDSFAPHLPKVAHGLTTMSESGRTSRGLQLDDSEESTEDSDEDDSSEETESSTSSEEDAGDGATQSETVKEIFTPKKAAPHSSPYGEPPYQNIQDPAEQYQQALMEKEAQEDGEDSDSDSDDSDESSEEDTETDKKISETSGNEEEDETGYQRKVAVPPPVPTQSPPQTSDLNTQDLATYQVSQSRHNQSSAPGFSNRAKKSAGFADAQKSTSKGMTEGDDENPYAVIDQATRSQIQPMKEGNHITHEQLQNAQPQNGTAHRRTRNRSSNFFDSEEEERSGLKECKSLSCESESSSSRGGNASSDGEETNVPAGQRESRGQKEMRLYQEHQRLRQEHGQYSGDGPVLEGPPLPPRRDEKHSKTCVVM